MIDSKKINKIIVACYKKDYYLTRICIASIRYFYPEIDILLLKDYKAGYFNTSELEKSWNVGVLELERKHFGWGFSKIEALLLKTDERVFIIDSDIVFIGKIIERLTPYHEDVIVSGEIVQDLNQNWIRSIYYNYDKLLEIDNSFQYPGFLFNTGNFVIRTGLLERKDFIGLVDWKALPSLIKPDIFSCADQGLLNYLLPKKMQEKKITIRNEEFMLWGADQVIGKIELSKIVNKIEMNPFLIHWAGTRHFLIDKMCRNDILIFFENYYYSKIFLGIWKKKSRNLQRLITWIALNNFRKFKKMLIKGISKN